MSRPCGCNPVPGGISNEFIATVVYGCRRQNMVRITVVVAQSVQSRIAWALLVYTSTMMLLRKRPLPETTNSSCRLYTTRL